jgi:hypothetical protein
MDFPPANIQLIPYNIIHNRFIIIIHESSENIKRGAIQFTSLILSLYKGAIATSFLITSLLYIADILSLSWAYMQAFMAF